MNPVLLSVLSLLLLNSAHASDRQVILESVTTSSLRFPYGKQPVRGVNLGSYGLAQRSPVYGAILLMCDCRWMARSRGADPFLPQRHGLLDWDVLILMLIDDALF